MRKRLIDEAKTYWVLWIELYMALGTAFGRKNDARRVAHKIWEDTVLLESARLEVARQEADFNALLEGCARYGNWYSEKHKNNVDMFAAFVVCFAEHVHEMPYREQLKPKMSPYFKVVAEHYKR